MASITDLVLLLSTEHCIAWVGSGPSIEVGLPSWQRLAAEVHECCRRQKTRHFQAIEAYYREGKYPEMFDEVERSYGREFLVDICRRMIEDPGDNGATYQTLANLHFKAYFTTNYDDLLPRHIYQARKAFTTYLNSPEALSAVDVDVTPALVKLHGDLSESDNAVLTRADYRRWYVSGEGNGYQTFLRGFLTRDRFLFVGYSMSDPEILQLQEQIQTDLRRKVRSIAILANVPEHEISRWSIDYNIDILPYRADDHNHSELTAILESAAKVLSVGQLPPVVDTAEDLRRAEALYLWYRFSPGQGATAPVDALQSVILSLLVNYPGGMDIDAIKAHLVSEIGVQASVHEADLNTSMQQLVESRWVGMSGSKYEVDPDNRKIVKTYERRFEDMMATFERQVTLDAVSLFGVGQETGPQFARLFIDTLIDIFQNRGREILRIVFEEDSISPSGALELIETVWTRSNQLQNPSDRPTFIRFVMTNMFEPRGIYGNVLNYFAKAFFCIQALGANQTINGIVADVIRDRALLIDANILIPLTARHEDRHQFLVAVINACHAAGISLYTTELALDEVRRHANWALNLTEDFGTLSADVLYAATGQGEYGANAFLKGFISFDPNVRDRSFLQYLRECFGGSYGASQFRDYFHTELGITVLDQETVREVIEQHRQVFDEARSKISQWNYQRNEDDRKTEIRIESEAEAFITVTNWDIARGLMVAGTGSQCSYLTYGTTVGRLGATLTQSLEMVSVQPEVIWEILTTLDVNPSDNIPEFRSLMNASYFRMSDHFIDKERYRTFFRPVIDAARAKLQGIHPFLQELLGVSLTDEYLDGYAVEDIPAVLSSVESAATRRFSSEESITLQVVEENEGLRAQLREYQERDARRKEFHERQRQRGRVRRQGRRRRRN